MAAVEPLFPAAGTWHLVSGSGTIADTTYNATAITGLGIGINVFTWTVYNGNCGFGPPTVDTVAVYLYDQNAPPADAGADRDVCGIDSTVTLTGNAVVNPAIGTWTQIAGSATFTDASDPQTTVSGLSVGTTTSCGRSTTVRVA